MKTFVLKFWKLDWLHVANKTHSSEVVVSVRTACHTRLQPQDKILKSLCLIHIKEILHFKTVFVSDAADAKYRTFVDMHGIACTRAQKNSDAIKGW